MQKLDPKTTALVLIDLQQGMGHEESIPSAPYPDGCGADGTITAYFLK